MGATIGVTPFSPGPNSRTQSDARETDASRGERSASACCTLTSKKSSTYTVVKKGSDFPPPGCGLILASGGTGVGFPSSHASANFTCAIIFFPSSSNRVDSSVVLQCACSAAEARLPQYPGDPDHPHINLKSITIRSPTKNRNYVPGRGLPVRSERRLKRRPCS